MTRNSIYNNRSSHLSSPGSLAAKWRNIAENGIMYKGKRFAYLALEWNTRTIKIFYELRRIQDAIAAFPCRRPDRNIAKLNNINSTGRLIHKEKRRHEDPTKHRDHCAAFLRTDGSCTTNPSTRTDAHQQKEHPARTHLKSRLTGKKK
ncbi:hypothetical protein CEXT_575451 [Caerostris extrusa]|uniref:Uncharacterized protein n=1 Tax=Caerostris extrusa TaxID=172846 RepID=A0AAV4SAA2_CAEEX|nr:hypothetical protein CEXT_575451 [Caerostris extrusa]